MDFSSLRERAERNWRALENLTQPLIQIGMGTCGKAAGADEVYAAAKQVLKQMNLLGRILQVGCIGTCYLEPMMGVRKPGGPLIYYGNLTAKRTEEILLASLQDDNPRLEWAAFVSGGHLNGIPRFEDLPMMKLRFESPFVTAA